MAWQTPKTNWGQAGQTVPGADDFNRIEGNIETLGRYDRAPGYGTATGTNAKAITLNPAPGSYYDGLCFAFKNATQNTGAVTINVNGMGAKAIKKPNGNDLPAGFLKAGSIYTVRYNGTNFILQGSDSSGDAMPEHVLAGKTFSNDADTGITGTMPNQGGNDIQADMGSDVSIPEGYYNGTGHVLKPEMQPGDNIIVSADRETTTHEHEWKKLKEIKINYPGTYRTYFRMKRQEGTGTIVEGRIYKNGSPYGTLRRSTTGSYLPFSEDLYFAKGDLCQLYGRAPEGYTQYFDNFRLYSATGQIDPEVLLD